MCRLKNCSWFLWLDGKKIYNIRQLRENFDTAALLGYYRGGSLLKWLSDIGEHEIIRRISLIDRQADIAGQLEFIFGVKPDKKPVPVIQPEYPPSPLPLEVTAPASSFGAFASSFLPVPAENTARVSSFGYHISSFEAASGQAGGAAGSWSAVSSFGVSEAFSALGSFSVSSLSFASSGGLIFGALYGSSFVISSFLRGYYSKGSFGFGGYFSLGSFGLGSFGFGTFGLGSYNLLGSSPISGSFRWSGTSSGLFDINGSFVYEAFGGTVTEQEYKRTLINLSSCPLNAYGYGINLI